MVLFVLHCPAESVHGLAPKILLRHSQDRHEAYGEKAGDKLIKLIASDGVTIDGDDAIMASVHLAQSIPSLQKYFPRSPAGDKAQTLLTIEFVSKQVIPAVEAAVGVGSRSDPSQAVKVIKLAKEIETEYLSVAGFVLGGDISLGDICIAAALMPFEDVGGELPMPIQRLLAAVKTAIPECRDVVREFVDAVHKMQSAGGKPFTITDDGQSPWLSDCGGFAPVQALDMLRLAREFEVDVITEGRLLWVLREVLETPLIPGFKKVVAPEEWATSPRSPRSSRSSRSTRGPRVTFLNEATGVASAQHPATGYIVSKLDKIRRNASLCGADLSAPESTKGTWMEFEALEEDSAHSEGGGGGGGGGGELRGLGTVSSPGGGEAEARGYFFNFETNTGVDVLPDGAAIVPRVSPTVATSSMKDTTVVESTKPSTLEPPMEMFDARDPYATEALIFTSWWHEAAPNATADPLQRRVNPSSMVKRTITIRFSLVDGSVQVNLHGDRKVYNISHIEGRRGKIECWDLYVGARIPILGRLTTLYQAASATQRWVDFHGERLRKVADSLQSELWKYDRRNTHVDRDVKRPITKAEQVSGGTQLRKLLDEVDVLRRRLAEYRPRRTAELLLPLYDTSIPVDSKTVGTRSRKIAAR